MIEMRCCKCGAILRAEYGLAVPGFCLGTEPKEPPQIVHAPTDTDPKGEAGKLKAPMELLPPHSLTETAWVHGLGAAKYGRYNWRSNQVAASTYVSAIMRHLAAWHSGEDLDPESGRSHLAHIAAGCNILMDAQQHGTLVDDRPK